MKVDPNQMTFLEHIQDLRRQLVKIIVGVLIASIITFIYGSTILDYVIFLPKEPEFITNRLLANLADLLSFTDIKINQNVLKITNFDLAGQFNTHISIAIYAGIIISAPNSIYQIWSFFKPALHQSEKKASRETFLSSVSLFILGVLFAYFIITPLTIHFFYNYSVSQLLTNQIKLTSYVHSISWMIMGTGILFQLPIIILTLAKHGLLTSKNINSQRRYVIIIIFIISAIITPPDIISLLLVAFPIYILYEISILVANKKYITAKTKIKK